MFRHEIIIGSGNKQCSATRITDTSHRIYVAANSTSYWVHETFIGVAMIIFKDSDIGEEYTRRLKYNPTLDHSDWLDQVAFERVSVETLKGFIKDTKEDSFEEGRGFQATLIQQALMLRL